MRRTLFAVLPLGTVLTIGDSTTRYTVVEVDPKARTCKLEPEPPHGFAVDPPDDSPRNRAERRAVAAGGKRGDPLRRRTNRRSWRATAGRSRC